MTLSKRTASFLLGLVNNLTLNVGAEDFDRALADVIAARSELQAILADPADPPS